MRTFRTAATALLLGAAVLAGAPAAAYAATAPTCNHVHQTSGNGYGLLNNLQLNAPVDLGLNVTGNAFALLGSATASSAGGTTTCG